MLCRLAIVPIIAVSVIACSGGDQLYCSRYQYLYNQLLEDDAPPANIIRLAIAKDRQDPSKDQNELDFMEQVLNDFSAELKPNDMSPKEFCLKNKRFKHSS